MLNKHYPRITIITSTYNCSDNLIKTASSIREQSYKNIQWIVIDGNSKDDTIKTIIANQDIITNWISEPDKGIYDAWNKACRFIDGEWILFLGAGDIFFDNNALTIFWTNVPINTDQYGIIYGNVYITKSDGTLRYLSRKPKLGYWEHGRIALPNHQGVFHKVSFFNLDKSFDSSLRIAGDTKFMMQILQTSQAYHVDVTISCMQDDGISNNVGSIMLARKEIRKICGELNIELPLSVKTHAALRDLIYLTMYTIIPKYVLSFFKRQYDSLRRL